LNEAKSHGFVPVPFPEEMNNENLCARTSPSGIFRRRTAAPIGAMENRVKAGLAPVFSAFHRIEQPH